jgi:hypothetical protein
MQFFFLKCKTNACNDDDKVLYLFNKLGMLHPSCAKKNETLIRVRAMRCSELIGQTLKVIEWGEFAGSVPMIREGSELATLEAGGASGERDQGAHQDARS